MSKAASVVAGEVRAGAASDGVGAAELIVTCWLACGFGFWA